MKSKEQEAKEKRKKKSKKKQRLPSIATPHDLLPESRASTPIQPDLYEQQTCRRGASENNKVCDAIMSKNDKNHNNLDNFNNFKTSQFFFLQTSFFFPSRHENFVS